MLFKYTQSDAYNDKEIAAKGRQDGANGIPTLDDNGPTPYEDELKQVNRQIATKVVKECNSELQRIDGEIAATHQRLSTYDEDNLQDDDLKQTEEEYDAEVDRCNSNPVVKQAQKSVDYTERAFTNVHARLNRMPLSYIPHWAYLLLAFIIGVGEIPLNALVFNIFGEAQIMTWIMSAVIGLFVPLTAHFIGIQMREHGEGFSWPNAIKAFVVFAIVTIAFFALALMRQRYLDLVKDDLGIDQRIVDASFMFFWLNIAVFVAAVIISYLAHDPVAGYPQLLRDKQKAEASLAKAQIEHHDCLKRALKAKNNSRAKDKEKMKSAKAKKTEMQSNIHRLEAKFDAVLKAGRQQEKYWLGQARIDIATYRSENMRARDPQEGGKRPKCFNNKTNFNLKLKRTLAKNEIPEEEDDDSENT